MTVLAVSAALSPSLGSARNGDSTVLAHLDQQAGWGNMAAYQNVAVAEVDLDAAQPVALAGIGATDTTLMEVGSMTKAMTGLVIADAVRRGEVRMDAPVATYLPQLEGSPAGAVTMHELVTHTSGYAEFGTATVRRAAWKAPLGQNFFTADASQMTDETRSQTLRGRGSYAYSTLGSAIAGQAVAAAARMSYPELMRTRLFEPLGMSHTAIQVDHALVAGGRSRTGLPVQPWVMDAYSPGAAAVSTTGDLAKLATALLEGTAPDRPDHHPPSRPDQRLRRLPRPRPPGTQGRHRPSPTSASTPANSVPSSSRTASSTAATTPRTAVEPVVAYSSHVQWCPDRWTQPRGPHISATVRKYDGTGPEFAHEPCEESCRDSLCRSRLQNPW
ncbi:MAG: beta-lactamase family protein [Micropruina sp.]|nr:beta-lactamase family protein [Micropruina sp.]